MIQEWKIFRNQWSQKELLLRLASLLFLLFMMNRQPPYPVEVISMLICFAASFGSLEYTVNVFGLDGYAFYLHHMGPSPLWIRLIRRVSVGMAVQILLAATLSTYFFFKTDTLHFRFHLCILIIILAHNFAAGCLYSAAFPRTIPKTVEKKIFRVHPGLGLSLAAGVNILFPAVFYVLCHLLPPATVFLYGRIVILFWLACIPLSAIWGAKLINKRTYDKLLAVTTEY
jgi:hypothetical protein